MILINKSKKKKFNYNFLYKLYFFLSLLVIFILFLFFVSTGFFNKNKENILNKIYFNGLNNYTKIFEITGYALKSFFINYDEINLNIDFEDLSLMEKERIKILEESDGTFRDINSEFSEYEISTNFKNDKFFGKLRLKGERITHYEKNNQSYKITLRGTNTILGARKFSLIKPRARNYIHEWLFHELSGEGNLIKLQYNFLKLRINGEDKGLYVFEENFDKILVERNSRRNGPIFALKEEYSSDIFSSDFNVYNGNFWENGDNLEILLMAKNNLYKISEESTDFNEIFDIEKWMWLFAISDLTYTHHGLSPENVKFYFNPISGLIEPIPYDGHRFQKNYSKHIFNFDHKLAVDIAIQCNEMDCSNKPFEKWLHKFFFDNKNNLKIENFKLYTKALNTITNSNFLKVFLNTRKGEINEINSKIYGDYFLIDNPTYNKYGPGLYYFSKKDLFYRADKIRQLIKPKLSKIQAYKNNKIIKIINNNEINNLNLKIVEIICTAKKNHNSFQKNFQIDLNMKNQTETIIKKLDLIGNNYNCEYVKFRDINSNSVYLKKIDYLPYKKYEIKDLIKYKKYFRIENKNLYLINSTTRIEEDIYIPPGFTVQVYPGEKIFLTNNSFITSFANWNVKGDKNNKVTISGDRNNFGGGIIIKDSKQQTNFENVIFSYLNGTDNRFLKYSNNENKFLIIASYLDNDEFFFQKRKINQEDLKNYLHQLNYLGGLNIYNTSVKINNSDFEYISSEDALNVISSKFTIQNTNFKKINSDAIDIDFGQGKIEDSKFSFVGNDAIDLSGSNVILKKIKLNEIGDKLISVGENSDVKIFDVTATNGFIGVASKDGSNTVVNKINFDNIKIPFACYTKKKFYNFPSLNLKSDISIKNFLSPAIKDKNAKITKNIESFKVKQLNNIIPIIYKNKLSFINDNKI